jgi:hypothetical protein
MKVGLVFDPEDEPHAGQLRGVCRNEELLTFERRERLVDQLELMKSEQRLSNIGEDRDILTVVPLAQRRQHVQRRVLAIAQAPYIGGRFVERMRNVSARRQQDDLVGYGEGGDPRPLSRS